MQPLKRILEASFRIKVLLPVITVMAALLLITVLIVSQRSRQQSEASARLELNTAGIRFKTSLGVHQNYLKQRFRSLIHQPVYHAVFETLDPSTIHDQLGRLADEENLADDNVEFISFSPAIAADPEDAEIMIHQRRELYSPQTLLDASRPAIDRALQGGLATDTIAIQGKLYKLVSLPVYKHAEHQLIGVVTFGVELDWSTAQNFSISARGQTVLLAGETIVASTFASAEQPANLAERFRSVSSDPAGLQRAELAGHHYYYTSGNFPSLIGDRSLGYLLFNSYDDQLQILDQTRRLLLSAILIGIIVGSLVILYFINKATAPLRELHNAAEAVGRGDFSHRLNIQSKDEFGELGHAFNQMTENIELSQSKLKQTVETLKTTQAQLIQSEKLSAVGEFVAGVAHELNNPLAAVMGFSEMLRNTDASPERQRHLDLVHKSAQRCQKIVQSLLSFARRSAPERKPVNVNRLIEEVLEMVAYPLRTSNVKVITHFAQRLPVVLADGHQIQQVILNIVNNARQAIESHHGSGRITLTTKSDARFVKIIIHDNGPGISPENLQRIFDPFFTTKEVGKGTGLGLSLCYGMIREHGGNIIPASRPGEGATFTIELPIADTTAWFDTATTTANSAPPAVTAPEGGGKKILCVDDEEALLLMMSKDLTHHGYQVTTVTNGEAALRALREHRFHAIVCDLKMPGLNGRQVYERLRVENPEAAQRMIFVTGDLVDSNLEAFFAAEKITCLAKPFGLAELRQALRTTGAITTT